jgi:hypothetical protein
MSLAATLEEKAERNSEHDAVKPPQAIIRTTTVNLTPEKF